MKPVTAVFGAVLAGAMAMPTAALASESAAGVAAPSTAEIICGTHAVMVDGNWLHNAWYWGNCTDQPQLVKVHLVLIGGPIPGQYLLRQECMPAQSDTHLGTTNDVRYRRYWGQLVPGGC